MSKSIFRTPFLMFLVTVSLFGLFLVGMLAFNPPIMRRSFPWRKPVIGSLFSSICILGILAVFLPRKCSRIFDCKKGEKSPPPHTPLELPTLSGHHPNCERFSAHVFQINMRTFCTGCTGLLLGGVTALVGTIVYFFGNWRIDQNSLLLIWVGALGVVAGLLQYPLFNIGKRLVRLFFNAFFIIGMFLILIGTDELARNIFVDLFLIILSIFWLFTRMSLSRWDHKQVCNGCRAEKCEFLQRT